jgi:hypothetical protein
MFQKLTLFFLFLVANHVVTRSQEFVGDIDVQNSDRGFLVVTSKSNGENIGIPSDAEFPIVLNNSSMFLFQRQRTFKGIEPEFPLKLTIPYVSYWNDSAWGEAEFRPPFTDKKESLVVVGSNYSGTTVLLTDDRTRTSLYTLRTDRARISRPEKLSGFFNGGFPIHSATMDGNNNMVIFSSRRVGSAGGFDLFYVTLANSRKSLSIKSLSPAVNTECNELFPQFSENDSLIFFSSDRAGGSGGFDIYYSALAGSSDWCTPLNMGTAINSENDDFRFFPFNGGRSAILTNRTIAKGLWENQILEMETGDVFPSIQKSRAAEIVVSKVLHPVIKGFISLKTQNRCFPMQISMLDTLGILFGTVLVDETLGTFEITEITNRKFFLVVSGNEIRTVSREVLIPPKYGYSTFIVDMATEQNYDTSENTFKNSFNAVSSTLNSFQQKEMCKMLTQREIENMFFTLELNGLPYPQYVAVDISDIKTIRQASENQKYTVVLTENATGLTPEKIKKINSLGYTNLWVDNSERNPKYCMGKFSTYTEAAGIMQKISKHIFEHAYIGLYDEKKDRVRAVKEGSKQASVEVIENQHFYVQIRSAAQPLDINIFPNPEKICTILDFNGIFRYIYGVDNLDDARQKQKQLKAFGFGSAAILTITK